MHDLPFDPPQRLRIESRAELEAALNGAPDRLLGAVPVMYQLGYQARALMNIPLGDGRVAGPRFRA